MTQQRDTVYQMLQDTITPFQFNDQIASVFDDMLHRSVPGYATILQQLPLLVGKRVTGNYACYDLGCSLGGAAFVLADVLAGATRKHACNSSLHARVPSRIIAVDNSQAMVQRLQERIQATNAPIDAVCQDITSIVFETADVVVMNFVLMFVPRAQRAALLADIYRALRPGGALVLSEKVMPSVADRTWMQATYHAYKQRQGYSDTEIAQKQAALADILMPDEIPIHETRLQNIGFQVHLWFRQWQFVSWIAVK